MAMNLTHFRKGNLFSQGSVPRLRPSVREPVGPSSPGLWCLLHTSQRLWFWTHLTLNLPFSILLRFQSSRKTKPNQTLPKTFPVFHASQMGRSPALAVSWRTGYPDVLCYSQQALRLQEARLVSPRPPWWSALFRFPSPL